MHSRGEFLARLEFSGSTHSYHTPFLVCNNVLPPLECILGWDFLLSHQFNLILHDSRYFLEGQHGKSPILPGAEGPIPPSTADTLVFEQSLHKGPVPLTLVSSIIIPARSEVVLIARVPRSSRNALGMVAPFVSDVFPSGLYPAYSVSAADSRAVPVRLINTNNEVCELHKGQRVADFCPISSAIPPDLPARNRPALVGGTLDVSNEVAHELSSALSSTLSSHERNTLLDTLLRYADVFEPSLGHTTVVRHNIDTGDSPPIRQRPRRLPYAYRKETEDQIRDMLDQGVIQPSVSPWASPIVLVRKKDGKYRFCVDYRKLNAVTKRDARPLPRVDDLLDALQGYDLFTTLDLRSGYWQLSVSPEDREKTAFVTPTGSWEFLRVPFGLSGAPASFDRAMQIIMSGLNYDSCLCYFDDIIIPSKGIQEHCERLEKVLTRLRQHNLKVKASKCCFAAPKVLYLGHTVSAKGIHTDPAKIKAVFELSEPSNLEQVRSFLGLAGYYRKFIPNFATVSAPLTDLTKKGSKFVWATPQQSAFSALKRHLCSAPVLSYPQLDKEFVLQTDASDCGLGAVLAQKDSQGNEHVVAYASRTLSDREKHYSAMEKEALAVVFATQNFRVYLLGKPFQLITDNRALTWLHSLEPKGRIARWIMDLQEFSFTVQHRAGKDNANADALSRLCPPSSFKPPSPTPSKDKAVCFVQLASVFNLQEEQQKDSSLQLVHQFKSNGMPKPPYFAWKIDSQLRSYWNCWDEVHLVDGLLVRYTSVSKGPPKRVLLIPQHMVSQVLESVHSGPSGGHMGITRTLGRVKERFYWPHMKSSVQSYVNSCKECIESKSSCTKRQAPLQPMVVSEPFTFWAMDYMGPLPETARGNKHILVVGDHFTKWCEAFPTQDQKAQTVANILVSRLFSRFGPPQILHSDQGTNFESNLIKSICDLMGIQKTRTTAYHPQGDGQIERQNRTLQEILSTFVSEHPDTWDLHVDQAVFAYNTSRHESTGFSPYELVFGRVARMPVEIDLGVPLRDPRSQSDYVQAVRQSIRSSQSIAQQVQLEAKAKQKQFYDQGKGTWTPIEPQSIVWLRRPKKWKFGRKWIGPYTVVSRTGVNYNIKSQEGKELVVHHNNLKVSAMPNLKGTVVCPTPESPEAYVVQQEATGGDEIRVERAQNVRPRNLRQVVNPPIRYGDIVTH